jgi:sialic acid synthase SpsE
MADIIFRNSRKIGDFISPYFIAEVNTSHFGDIETAKKMITKAKECSCDCVKFQSWSTDSLYSENFYLENPIAKRMFSKFSFSAEDLKILSEFCDKQEIDFASTPYSIEEVDFLVEETNAPFIKVASMDLTNLPFLKYIAKTSMPIVLSTGMATYQEVQDAVKAITGEGNDQLTILHCVATYPVESKDVRLMNMIALRERFPKLPIGYSDHTIGLEVPCAAVAQGACIIEKHFTLDRSRIGMDNQMATESEDFEKMILLCHSVHSSLGGKERILSCAEIGQKEKMTRSLVATRDLSIGHTIVIDDLCAKRPGTGVPVSQADLLIGKKVISEIKANHLILSESLS